MNGIKKKISDEIHQRTFYELIYYFDKKYKDYIKLYDFNDFYRAFKDDAYLMSNIFGYHIFKFEDRVDCCGFPVYIIDRIEEALAFHKINYIKMEPRKDSFEICEFTKNANYHDLINQQPEDTDNQCARNFNEGIDIGDVVYLVNIDNGEMEKYTIIRAYYEYRFLGTEVTHENFGTPYYQEVPISDIDPDNGIISSDSLVAKTLLFHQKGDIVELPAGKFEIVKISKASDNVQDIN